MFEAIILSAAILYIVNFFHNEKRAAEKEKREQARWERALDGDDELKRIAECGHYEGSWADTEKRLNMIKAEQGFEF